MNENKNSATALLLDPTRVSVSMSQAAAILGIAKSTAHKVVKQTGRLCDGVPVLQFGKRQVVSTFHLRAALGIDLPTNHSRDNAN